MPLIIVPTPVGNMEDITLRALRILREADVIACEDTRRTRKILSRYNIRTPMISCHSFNEKERGEMLLERLEKGETVALVSDAGTPAISDPGFDTIRKALDKGQVVDVLPGATAFVPALLLSGFSPQPFWFEGFLPRKQGERRRRLQKISSLEGSVVIYLSPHGAGKVLGDIADIMGEREAAIVREISKVFQESIRGTVADLAAREAEGSLRGEMVLVIGPRSLEGRETSDDWEERASALLREGLSGKEVVKRLHEEYGIAKNMVKRFLLGKGRDQEVSG